MPVPGKKLKEKHCNQKLQITDQSVLAQCTQLHPDLPPEYCTCSHPTLGVSIFCTTNCPILSRYGNNMQQCSTSVHGVLMCAACPYPQKDAWLGTLASVPPQTVSLLIGPPGRSTHSTCLGVVSCYDANLLCRSASLRSSSSEAKRSST